MHQRDSVDSGYIFDATTGPARKSGPEQGEAERLSAADYHQVCSARAPWVSDPHILLLTCLCSAVRDTQSGCAQVRHDEHLGECFEAVLDQIAIGGHPGGAEQIAADQSFVTVLRGVSPTGATLSGPQASPPSFPIVCIR